LNSRKERYLIVKDEWASYLEFWYKRFNS